jgi:Predicted membrane protein (DUF2142)
VGSQFNRWRWLWLPLAFFVLGSAWAISSPVGSSPDDDYHLASIWCAQGDKDQACQDTGLTPAKFIVAAGAVNSAFCFATKPEVTGECTAFELNSTEMILTDRVNNIQQLYPGGYYSALSVFVGTNVETSVYIMRVFNVFIFSLLLALLLRVAPSGISQATVLAVVAAFIPLGIFLIASTNPSGWAIGGILFFLAFGLALMNRSSWRHKGTWIIAIATVITGSMAIASRVDSAAFISVAALVIVVLSGKHLIVKRIPQLLVVVVMAILGVITYVRVTPLETSGELGTSKEVPDLFLNNLVDLPQLIQGIVGSWPLGWNDTVLPPLVSVVGLLVVGALVFAGMSHLWLNKSIAMAIAFLAFLGFPLAFMQTQGVGVGEVIQSRYLLPLFSLLMFVVVLMPRMRNPLPLPRGSAFAMTVAVWVTASLAFWANAHRYSVGNTVGLFDVSVTWSYGPPIWATTTLAIVASAIVVVGAFLFQVSPRSHPPRSHPTGSHPTSVKPPHNVRASAGGG